MRRKRNVGRRIRLLVLVFSALAALLLLPVVGCSGSGSSTPPPPPPPAGVTNFVYTANAAGTSTVSALVSDATTGALSAISGSPYTSGSGSRSIKADPTGKFVYVANSSSGDISAFSINATTGGLTEVANSPFAAEGGLVAVTVDPASSFLYAASGATANLWILSIDSSGALHNLATSPVVVDPSVALTALAIDPSGKYLFVAASDSLTSKLYVFSRDTTAGTVSEISGSPYSIDHSGNSIVTDPAGKYVFVAASGSSTLFGVLDVFQLDATTGSLSPVAGSPFHTGVDPASIALDPAGKFVYVANTSDATISAFSLDAASGNLAPVTGSPFPSGGHGSVNGPLGIVVDASGKYVYVCNASNDISVFTFGSTGVLSALSNSPFPMGGSAPSGITVVQKK